MIAFPKFDSFQAARTPKVSEPTKMVQVPTSLIHRQTISVLEFSKASEADGFW